MNICVYVCEGLSEEIIQGCCVQLSNVSFRPQWRVWAQC